MLWGRRNTASKYHWCVWGVLTVYGPHWICPSSRQHVLLGSTLLRLQGALQGYCPKWAFLFGHFPDLSCSVRFSFLGTPQRHRLSWACILCPSQVQAAQVTRCLVSALSQVGGCLLSPPPSQPFCYLGAQGSTISGVPCERCVSSGELISGCDTLGRCQLSRIPGGRG